MQGWSDKQIAQELGITPVTVRTHFARLCARYGATNRCQLAYFATTEDLPGAPTASEDGSLYLQTASRN